MPVQSSEDEVPVEQPKPLTPQQLTDAIQEFRAQHEIRNQKMVILALGLMAVFILALLGLMLPYPSKTPAPTVSIATVDSLKVANADLSKTVVELSDSLANLGRRFGNVEEQSRTAIVMVEQRAGDLDQLRTDVNRLQINPK